MHPPQRWRAGLAAALLGVALGLAGAAPQRLEAQQSHGYSSRIEYGCYGRSLTEWANGPPITGVLNHEKWQRDTNRWVRANARRTTDGPRSTGRIDHPWNGSRGRTNRIIAIHSWSDRPGAVVTSSGDFYCP